MKKTKKTEIKEIYCTVTKKAYKIKALVYHYYDMPKSADYYKTAYAKDGLYNIYRTPAGVLYAVPGI